MALPTNVERQLNAAISRIHQTRDVMRRAKDYGDLMAGLQSVINSLPTPSPGDYGGRAGCLVHRCNLLPTSWDCPSQQ